MLKESHGQNILREWKIEKEVDIKLNVIENRSKRQILMENNNQDSAQYIRRIIQVKVNLV